MARKMYPTIERMEEGSYLDGSGGSGADYFDADKDDWYAIFQHFNPDPSGRVPLKTFRRQFIGEAQHAGYRQSQIESLTGDIDKNGDNMVDYEEFCYMMANVQRAKRKRIALRAAQMVVPKSQREDRFRYLQQYNCCPPPIFMILISLIEISVYIWYVVEMKDTVRIDGPIPYYSPLIWDPARRYQAWRYLTYMMIHVGIYHIVFNVIAQIVLGLPLELVHKFWRIAIVYFGGVIAGSLAHSLFEPRIFLAGASGGVYALIAAHLSNLIVNWKEMEFAWARLLVIAILIGSDVGVAIYNRYAKKNTNEKVSYVAHLGGFVMGLCLGIVVLRNLVKRSWERVVWIIALVVAILLIVWAVLWNIFYTKQYADPVYNPFLFPKRT